MILRPPSSFQQGERVRIELLKINLEAGADKEYPNGATGTVAYPYFTNKDGEVDFDEHKAVSLEEQRIAFVLLDDFDSAITIPEWLLNHLKPEEDPFVLAKS